MSQNEQPAGQQIQVKITDDILKGVYSNIMQVSHTGEEFILDFMNIVGGAGMITSRVIVSPDHMKRIVAALQDNLQRYEKQFRELKAGQINPVPSAPSSTGPHIGFDTNKAE